MLQGQQIGSGNTQNIILPGRVPRQAPRRVRFHLPRVVASFAARQDELALIEHRWPGEAVQPPVQVITGLPGVGKTQLAAAYLATHAAEYDLVAWVRAVDPVTDLAALADQVNLTDPDDTPVQRAERALAALAAWDEPWLLALDNIDDPAVLERWCPTSGPGRVLVTARSRQLTGFGQELHLAVFDLSDATDLLLRQTGRPQAERAGAEQVARALGRLPLALQHAAAFCSLDRGGPDFPTYLALLDELPAGELFDHEPEAFYQQTVASTWATSISAAIRQAPLAADILNMAAVLSPDNIPLPLFNVLIRPDSDAEPANSAPPDPAARPTAVQIMGRKRLRDALTALHDLSLAQLDSQHLAVHRLLQKVVRDQLDEHADTRPLHLAVTAVASAAPGDVNTMATWPLWQALIPHAQALATRPPASIGSDTAEVLLNLLDGSTSYLQWSGRIGAFLDLATRTQALSVALLGADHQATLNATHELAVAHRVDGHSPEAIAISKQLLADRERLLGPGHRNTLRTRANLAASYRQAGRNDEAIPMEKQVLADRERLLGPDHRETLSARLNLAHSYWAAGRTGEAIPLEEQVLTYSERLFGLDHPDTLTARANLAVSYGGAGRTDEAIPMQEQVLAGNERLLGPDHPNTLHARANLAASYRQAGRNDEAIPMEKQVLADRERLLGPDHRETLSARLNLAHSYWAAGRTGEAIPLEEQVLTYSERLFGLDHPDTLAVRANLAVSYRQADRDSDAARLATERADS